MQSGRYASVTLVISLAVSYSASVGFFQITWCNIPEDSRFNIEVDLEDVGCVVVDLTWLKVDLL